MMFKRSILIFGLLLLIAPLISLGQNINPGPKKIYKEDEIAIINITMDPADKAWMLDDENRWSDIYQTATFSFKNSDIDTTLTFDVGIRLRGNTSRDKPKKSFKIKFKEFGGEKFFDLKKFNLKAEVNDPTLLREMLSLHAFRDFDVPAARSHHAEVYINGEYMGLYLNVEQIDDEFVQRRFTYNAGNIYKCYWGANLADASQVYNNEIFELETNKEINDRSKLQNFINVLNNTPSSSFISEIEKVFDVDRYIKYMAVEALVGHWDGYSYNQNNFYLYENDETGLIEFIAYDVDNTFGLDWVQRDWGTRDVLDWVRHGNENPRPLSHKILAQETYFERYKRYLDQLLKTTFSTSNYYPILDAYEVMLADAVGRDTYFPQSFEYSVSDYHANYDDGLVDYWWLPYGLKSYISTRASSARDQVGLVTSVEEIIKNEIALYPNPVEGNKLFLRVNNQDVNLQIFDIQGRPQHFDLNKTAPSLIEINHNLPAGVYVISGSETNIKFVVK